MNLSTEDLNFLEQKIRGIKPSRILLQAPEGMKTSVQEIANKIRALGPECIIWADPCFGACDIPEHNAKVLGCDLIVHIGHAPFLKNKVPVLFLESRMETDFSPIVKSGISAIPYKKIGLLATIQHIGEIQKVAHILEKEKKTVFLGKSLRMKYEGQVLGCDAGAAITVEPDVECFLLLSGGKFHALGVLKKVQKPVFLANADTGKIENLLEEKKLMEKKRILKLAKLKDAKNVGILVSTKAGQLFSNFEPLRKKLEAEGKNVWIIAMDYISPEKLLGMKLDALVNTACPRIEDDLLFSVPIIDNGELWVDNSGIFCRC